MNDQSTVKSGGFFAMISADLRRYGDAPGKLRATQAIKAIFLRPGFQLVLSLRVQRLLGRLPILGKPLRFMLWYLTTLIFGCDIDMGASLGPGLYLPHAHCIVIGGRTRIGSQCTILHGVTIGRKSQRDTSDPIIEDDCFIGCNSTLIGPIRVGQGSRIGAQCLVMCDVPPNARVMAPTAQVVEL